LQELQQKIRALEEEKRFVEERQARGQVEADALREELSRLTSTNAELNTKVSQLEVQSALTVSDAVPLHREGALAD
jgi:predicted nuclease with TOPRIM domain